MGLSVFAGPERYVQGRDATEALGKELAGVGCRGPVLVVASKAAVEQLSAAWERSFKNAGFEYKVEAFGGECSAEEIDRLAALARGMGAQTVCGAGGGKCVDAARGAAALLELPFACCPTLASTDAPCSALSVLYKPDGTFDSYRFHARHPALVLLDTTVVARAPVRALVGGLGDALATWYEARTVAESGADNQIRGKPTAASMALATLCRDILLRDGRAAVRAVQQQAVVPALERVAEANTLLSGLGFECGGLACAHSVHNGLTACPGAHGLTHGEKVAFGLVTQLVLEGRPTAELEEVLTFCEDVGLPTTFAGVGLDPRDAALVAAVAERTVAPGETVHHTGFPVTAVMIADAMRAADAAGREHAERRGVQPATPGRG
ncbi:iron-containing alcohol dehydrogenase [Hyaloraphidium curvatum]|nr:iron-containing alcohol dehydrogenase [Hyaloraphidium curvatum]